MAKFELDDHTWLRQLARAEEGKCGPVGVWGPRLRQIAQRLEAGKRPATPMAICSYAGPQDIYSCGEEATATMVDGPRCEKHLGVWSDRMTATEVTQQAGDLVYGGELISWDHLRPLGLAGGTATATAAAKVESPEPCICPPGGVSRSCRAVGFRSGIMHKDRE